MNFRHKWPVTRKCLHLMTSSCASAVEFGYAAMHRCLMQPVKFPSALAPSTAFTSGKLPMKQDSERVYPIHGPRGDKIGTNLNTLSRRDNVTLLYLWEIATNISTILIKTIIPISIFKITDIFSWLYGLKTKQSNVISKLRYLTYLLLKLNSVDHPWNITVYKFRPLTPTHSP